MLHPAFLLQTVVAPGAGDVLANQLVWWAFGALATLALFVVGVVGKMILKRLDTNAEAVTKQSERHAQAHAETSAAIERLRVTVIGVDGENGLRGEVRKLDGKVEQIRRRTHRLNNRLYREQLAREQAQGLIPGAVLQPRDVGLPDRRAEARP